MLALAKVKEVERMLALEAYSQRRIAAAIGVSRATVSAIARGTRPNYVARLQARAAEREPTGPLGRCPTCGGRVYMPCRLCRVRKLKAQERETINAMRRQAKELAARRFLTALRRVSGAA